ncbi:hypothetical protein [uncultured Dechloromonas sp.]|uniref:hypothetical protein n=1 Tax=uncultured Dechloromonas sp. TaxID=171719 RepID=UPI0025D75E74|nr:hypothetical protein [uncultured Dechloromonas sp.]
MINESSEIQLAIKPEKFFPLATSALRAAASEMALSAYPSWPQPQPLCSLESQLIDVQGLVWGKVKKAIFNPSEDLFALAATLGFPHTTNYREWARIREAVNLALLDLSYNAAILLPAHQDYSKEEFPEFQAVRVRPLVLQAYKALRDDPDLPERGSRRIASLVSATDWRDVSDVSIDDLARVTQSVVRHAPELAATGSALAVLPFLYALESLAPNLLSRELRHQFMMWQASSQFLLMPFDEFRCDPKNFAGMRVHGHKRERVETPELIAIRRQKNNQMAQNRRANRGEPPFILNLREIAASGDSDAPERYFESLAGSRTTDFRKENWLQTPTPYPGREHIPIQEMGRLWFAAMNAWIAHREANYETDKEVRMSLHMLVDYVLMYLPWWNETHIENSVELPSAPKHFARYLFVSRTVFHSEQGGHDVVLPKTLVELLHLRRPLPDGKNIMLGHWQRFFQFVITAFEDNDLIAGKKMVNPIRLDFDRVKSSARTKTNKVPFAEDVFPLLVFYCQALEAFGEYLQQSAYSTDRFKNLPFGEVYGYNTAAWGYVPYVRYRGEVLPIRWIPSIYPVARRSIQANPEGLAGIYVKGCRLNYGENRVMVLNMPHLTIVRMLLTMVETGLRGQNVQWLDRFAWDSVSRVDTQIGLLHTWEPPESFTLLLVNTDKSRDEPWTTYVSWRVRRSLLAESYFQAAVADLDVDEAVLYEGRKNSRFDPIVPLFRSYKGMMPFGDNTYSVRWLQLLTGFEDFYNNAFRGVDGYREKLGLVTIEPAVDASGSFLDTTRDKDALQFCKVKFVTVHTPHATRSTYATLKDGDLEVSEIAEQLGHTQTVTTNHYQVPSKARIVGKLERIEARLKDVAYDVDGSGAGYIDNEGADSSVRAAFSIDRDKAIQEFGFMPGVALWSLNDLTSDEESSIELLRRSPSSVIRWHPTHVCPVGNQCPSEIIVRTGGLQRCGLCPLAVKCIDHLPAIAAKKNELKERIRMTALQIQALVTRKGATQSQKDALHRSQSLDAKELIGWQLSSQILHDKMQSMGPHHEGYHADQPEMVKRHLQLITRDSTTAEFFLQRIADSNAYPSLESPEVRARATKYVQIIMARAGREDDAALLDLEPYSELAAFASLIKPMADAKGVGIPAVAEMLSGGKRNELGVVSGPSLLGRIR